MKRKTSKQQQASCVAVRGVPFNGSRFAAPPTNHTSPTDPPQHGGFARSRVKFPLSGEALRFERAGRFRAGEAEREVPLGSLFLANVPTLRNGWARWRDDEPVAIMSGFLRDGYRAPERADLGDVDPAQWDYPDRDPWQRFVTVMLMAMPSMEFFTFVTAIQDDRSAVASLVDAWNKRGRLKLPVVRLQSLSRRQEGMLRLCCPLFQIIGWAGGDDAEEDAPTPKMPAVA